MTRRGLSFRVIAGDSPHDRAMAGSAAMHAQYSKGNETGAQISAQESNLTYANAARLGGGSVTNINKVTKAERIRSNRYRVIKLPKTGNYITATMRGRRYGERFQNGAYLESHRPTAMGVYLIAFHGNPRVPRTSPKALGPTGIVHRFVKEIGVGNFDRRTSWVQARRSSGFTKVVKPRSKRLAHQKNWIHRGHMWIPK